MPTEKLLTISTFARAVGVPASALRHYASLGILEPADVDPVSGYRYYAPSQIEDGLLVQQMRAAQVPLETMRTILREPPGAAAAVVEGLLAEHSDHARDRRVDLGRLRRQFLVGTSGRSSAHALISGPLLSRAIMDVLAATTDADDRVAGVAWDITGRGLELAATDRYWLVHRALRAETEGGPRSITTSPADALEIAERIGRTRRVDIEVGQGTVILRANEPSCDVARYRAVDLAVPHLGLLVTTQPEPAVQVSVDRRQTLDLLGSVAPDGPLLVRARDGMVELGGVIVDGWSRAATAAQDPPPQCLDVHLQPALLARALAVVEGAHVLPTWNGGDAPLIVQTDAHDTLTCLVMPMRP